MAGKPAILSIMIKEHSAILFTPEYLKKVRMRTGVKPKHVDAFFKWVVGGITRTNDRVFFEAFKEIRKQVPDWYFPAPKYPLYRDVEVNPQAIHDLQERTIPIKLKPRILTSWKESHAVVDGLIEQASNSEKVGLTVEGNPKRVVCIITPKLVSYMDPEEKLAGLTRDLNEVIIYGNGVDHIIPKSIKTLNWQGKTLTLDRFQGLFKTETKDIPISYDNDIQRYLFGVRVYKVVKQPLDGKSFIYLIKNTTNNSMAEAIQKLTQSGFYAGKPTQAKKGMRVSLVSRREKLGITLEENTQMRIIRVTLYPLSNV